MHSPRGVKWLAVVTLACGCASSARATCGDGWAALSRREAPPRLGLQEREDVTIARVAITGVDDSVARTLRTSLQTRPGVQVTEAPLGEDLRALWSLGVIADARVEVRGDEVTFALVPRPPIDKVVRRGGDALAQARFRRLEGAPFEPSRIHRMTEALRESYVKEGRLDATVEARQRVHATGVDVCVATNPGPRVTIAKLDFTGAKALPKSELLAMLHGKEANVNRVGGALDEAALEYDEIFLQAAYYERGHADVSIGKPKIVRRGNRLHVAIPVDEGPVYRLGTIAAPTTTRLRSGELFQRSRIVEAIGEIQQQVGDAGVVVPLTTVDRDARRIDIRIVVEWRFPWDALGSWLSRSP